MSNVGVEGRSFLAITQNDLKRLTEIAKKDHEEFFATHPQWKKYYSNRVLCIALCQGAAKHYVDNVTGINDFDVYTFFLKHPSKDLYAKRIKSYDFGDPKFGKSIDKPEFTGRRVDCLFRAIEKKEDEKTVTALQRYLKQGRTETAKLLSAKAVVLLEPNLGQIIWQ